MSYYNKKGMVMPVIVALLVTVISAIILVGFTLNWGEISKKEVKQKICAWSAVIKDKTNSFSFLMDFELKCDTITVKVGSKEDLSKIAVENMYDCWSNLGRGELDIISGWRWGRETVCVICSKIIPKDSKKTMKLSDFEYALNNYKIKGKDAYFVNYITGQDEYMDFNVKGKEDITITKKDPLYTVYFFYKLKKNRADVFGTATTIGTTAGATVGTLIAPGIGSLIGAGTGYILGIVTTVGYANDLRQGITILQGEEIINSCDILR